MKHMSRGLILGWAFTWQFTLNICVSSGLEISQNKIYGGECDSCKFELNKNTLLFSIDVICSYFRPCSFANIFGILQVLIFCILLSFSIAVMEGTWVTCTWSWAVTAENLCPCELICIESDS